jgi:hypothetical protein
MSSEDQTPVPRSRETDSSKTSSTSNIPTFRGQNRDLLTSRRTKSQDSRTTGIPAVPPSSAFDVRIAEFASEAAARNTINDFLAETRWQPQVWCSSEPLQQFRSILQFLAICSRRISKLTSTSSKRTKFHILRPNHRRNSRLSFKWPVCSRNAWEHAILRFQQKLTLMNIVTTRKLFTKDEHVSCPPMTCTNFSTISSVHSTTSTHNSILPLTTSLLKDFTCRMEFNYIRYEETFSRSLRQRHPSADPYLDAVPNQPESIRSRRCYSPSPHLSRSRLCPRSRIRSRGQVGYL